MRTYKVLYVFAVVTLAALIICLAPVPGGVASGGSSASPFLKVGPQAIPASAAGPGYGLFSCQVGLSVGACYDPYQMRHAYNVDTLINAGFDGRGKTIVIIDASSPRTSCSN